MSQENVETVRRAIEAFNAGGVEAALPYIDSDFVGRPDPTHPEGAEPVRGHEGLFTDWWTTGDFTEPRLELVELREFGDQVLTLYRQSALSARSGTRVIQQGGAVWSEFRDGRIGEARFFLTWDEALEAVGLSE